ncbi:MAG TPA: DNA mismatch repair endonuclease MutL [Candidatus Gastranaerophilales bacterium]|nr:DNA mismatch repair endonuclease MutL [Candidatus Gastranaerophilales bacterium]
MKKIKLLPENLINQIAAGEVIERPASVVKELVENSIDAGATRIEVEISNGCRNVRIADNGHGIDKEDVSLAFSRHATSKIIDQNDLWNISTLGFRGEALASIISVAKVTCITKTQDSNVGIKVECENSEIKVSETGCAKGTIMEITDLFYNIPARLKFLKKQHTELALISETLQSLALANPEVAFNLINNKNSILKTLGSNDIKATIGEIYSKNIISEFSEVYKEDPPFKLKVTGFISNPDFTRSNKKAIYTFVNHRTVKCPIILKAIDMAYKDMIASGKYPYAVLNILISPEEIDVNVHPAKREVKYRNPNLIFNFIYSAIKAGLDSKAFAPVQTDTDREQAETISFNNEISKQHNKNHELKVINFTDFNKHSHSKTEVFNEIEPDDIREVVIKEPMQSKFELMSDYKEDFVQKPLIIGQLDNTYILLQAPEGLQVVDQHIAHERYLYEKLKQEKTPASQMLLISESVMPDEEQIFLLKENVNALLKYGYELEFVSGDTAVKLKRVPQILAQKDPQKIINDLLEALEASPDIIEDELLMRIACRASVKAGERLSLRQMEELIINWQKTNYPKTCPHGRKISHIISTKEIAGFFGRLK